MLLIPGYPSVFNAGLLGIDGAAQLSFLAWEDHLCIRLAQGWLKD